MALTRPRLGQLTTNVAAISDPITVLHSTPTQSNVDVGFVFNRSNGLNSNVALYWNEANVRFATVYTPDAGGSDPNVAITSYAPIATGDHNIFGNLSVSGTVTFLQSEIIAGAQVTAGNVVANSGVASTSTTSGALVVVGGTGISGNLNIGGNINSAGYVNANLNGTAVLATNLVGGSTGQIPFQTGTNATSFNSSLIFTTGNSTLSATTVSAVGLVAGATGLKTQTITSSSSTTNIYADGTQSQINIGTGTANVAIAGTAWVGSATSAGGYFWANGNPYIPYSNVTVATYLPVYSGNLSAGNISVTYNETIGRNLTVNGNSSVGGNLVITTQLNDSSPASALGVLSVGGPLTTPDYGYMATFVANINTYAEVAIQNTSNGTAAYSSVTWYNGNTNVYGEHGLNGIGYSYASIGYPNNSLNQPNNYFSYSANTEHVIGTWTTNGIHFITNASAVTADAMYISPIGNIVIPTTTTSINTTTGALTVAGGVGIDGNAYIGGNVTVTNTFTSNTISSVNSTVNVYTTGAQSQINIGTSSATVSIPGSVSTGALTFGAIPTLQTSSTTTGIGSSPVAIDTFATATYRGAKYVITTTDVTNSQYQTAEIIVVHDGTTPTISVYGVVNTGPTTIMTFSAGIATGTVTLYGTGVSASNTVKLVKMLIPV